MSPYYTSHCDYFQLQTAIKVYRPRVIYEVGTATGHTTRWFGEEAPWATIYTIDLPNAEMGPDQQHEALPSDQIGYEYKGSPQEKQIIQIIGNSQDPSFVLPRIHEQVDLAFVDGDHRYEGVYADSRVVFNLMKDHSLIFWHDANLEHVWRAICDFCYKVGIMPFKIADTYTAVAVVRRI